MCLIKQIKINEIQQTINLMHRKINKTTPKQINEKIKYKNHQKLSK